MPDLEISNLPPLAGTSLQGTDVLAVADLSASETKKITSSELVAAGYDLQADGSLDPDKIDWDGVNPEEIDGSAIKTNSIPADRIVANSLTATQIAPNAIGSSELADNAVDTAALQNQAVTGAKIANDTITAAQIAPNAVGASELANGAVDTAAILDGAVTNAKLAGGITSDKITSVDGASILADSITATQIAPNAITASELADSSVDTPAIVNGAVTNDKLASGIDGAKLTDDTVTAAKIPGASLDRGLDKSTGAIGHTNSIGAGSGNGISFDAQGHVTGTSPLTAADLPIATPSTVGGVSVPASSGLSVSGAGALNHQDTIVSSSRSGITYNSTGHITATRALVGSDLPTATAAQKGAVSVPGPALGVDTNGVLSHSDSGVTAGTHQSVTVDARGHVTSGGPLTAAMIPPLDASKINTGTLAPAQIGNRSIDAIKLNNFAVGYIQEAQPSTVPADNYVSQLWFQESTGQLRMWNGNSWFAVGFGRLSQENLRFAGLVDASTGVVTVLTQAGISAGLIVGDPVPAATNPLSGVYLVVEVPGNAIAVTPGISYDNGDWCLCIDQAQGWERIDTLAGGGGGGTQRLDDLLDVVITNPQEGDTIVFNSQSSQWENISIFGQKVSIIEPFDGVRTTFTLSTAVANSSAARLSLGGVIQNPDVDYVITANTTTLVFNSPPQAGLDYFVLVASFQAGGGGGGGGVTLPIGTAAEEYLRWNNSTQTWIAADTLDGGTY